MSDEKSLEEAAVVDWPDIFVSHSHLDAEIATELVSHLHEAGFRCFVAERDISVKGRWEPQIRDNLKAARIVLILLTPRSLNSPWVAV